MQVPEGEEGFVIQAVLFFCVLIAIPLAIFIPALTSGACRDKSPGDVVKVFGSDIVCPQPPS